MYLSNKFQAVRYLSFKSTNSSHRPQRWILFVSSKQYVLCFLCALLFFLFILFVSVAQSRILQVGNWSIILFLSQTTVRFVPSFLFFFGSRIRIRSSQGNVQKLPGTVGTLFSFLRNYPHGSPPLFYRKLRHVSQTNTTKIHQEINFERTKERHGSWDTSH